MREKALDFFCYANKGFNNVHSTIQQGKKLRGLASVQVSDTTDAQ
jgi:hypothetical protein